MKGALSCYIVSECEVGGATISTECQSVTCHDTCKQHPEAVCQYVPLYCIVYSKHVLVSR